MEKETLLLVGTVIILLIVQVIVLRSFLRLVTTAHMREQDILVIKIGLPMGIALSILSYFLLEWWLIFIGVTFPVLLAVVCLYYGIEEAIAAKKYARKQSGLE